MTMLEYAGVEELARVFASAMYLKILLHQCYYWQLNQLNSCYYSTHHLNSCYHWGNMLKESNCEIHCYSCWFLHKTQANRIDLASVYYQEASLDILFLIHDTKYLQRGYILCLKEFYFNKKSTLMQVFFLNLHDFHIKVT